MKGPPTPPPMRRGDGGVEYLQRTAQNAHNAYLKAVTDLNEVCSRQTALVWLGLALFLAIEIPVLAYFFK